MTMFDDVKVRDLMVGKVKTVSPGETIRKTVQIMSKSNIGAIVVVESDERPIGILPSAI